MTHQFDNDGLFPGRDEAMEMDAPPAQKAKTRPGFLSAVGLTAMILFVGLSIGEHKMREYVLVVVFALAALACGFGAVRAAQDPASRN